MTPTSSSTHLPASTTAQPEHSSNTNARFKTDTQPKDPSHALGQHQDGVALASVSTTDALPGNPTHGVARVSAQFQPLIATSTSPLSSPSSNAETTPSISSELKPGSNSEGTLSTNTRSLLSGTSTETILQTAQQHRTQLNLQQSYDYRTYERGFLKHSVTLAPIYPQMSKKMRQKNPLSQQEMAALTRPIQMNYISLFNQNGIAQLYIKGSSAEFPPEEMAKMLSPGRDLDIGAPVALLDQERSLQRFCDMIRHLNPTLKNVSNAVLLKAFTHGHKTPEGAYKFTLKTGAKDPSIDLTLYDHLAAEFDSLTAATRIRLDLNKKTADQFRSIGEQTSQWMRKNHLAWMNEHMRGGLQRVHKRIHDDPKLKLLQPEILQELFDNSDISEQADFIYRTLHGNHFQSKTDPVWHALLSRLFLAPDNAAIDPANLTDLQSHLLTQLSQSINGKKGEALTPAQVLQELQAYLQNQSSERISRSTLATLRPFIGFSLPCRESLLTYLASKETIDVLWPLCADVFSHPSIKDLLQYWSHAEQQGDETLQQLLIPLTQHYGLDPDIKALDQDLLTLHLLRAQDKPLDEMRFLSESSSLLAKNELVSSRASKIMKSALRAGRNDDTTVKALFHHYTKLPIKPKHYEQLFTELNRPPTLSTQSLSPELSQYLLIKEQLTRVSPLILLQRWTSKDVEYALKELSELQNCVKAAEAMTELPWSLKLPCSVQSSNNTISTWYDDTIGFYCGPTKKGKPAKNGLLLTLDGQLNIGPYRINSPCDMTLYAPDGQRYEGTTLNGKPHGRGAHIYQKHQLPKPLATIVHQLIPQQKGQARKLSAYQVKGEFKQGTLTQGELRCPSHSNRGKPSIEQIVITITNDQVSQISLENYRDFPQARLVFNHVDQLRIDHCEATIHDKQGQATIVGPYDASTRSLTGSGTITCPHFTYEGQLENNEAHGHGLFTFTGGGKAFTQVKHGQMIDPLLEQFEQELKSSEFYVYQPLIQERFPYQIPHAHQYAAFSKYNDNDRGVVGIWQNGRVSGWLKKIEGIAVLNYYKGDMVMMSARALDLLNEKWNLTFPNVNQNNVRVPMITLPEANARESIMMPHRNGRVLVNGSTSVFKPFFLGKDFEQVEEITESKKFADHSHVYRVSSSFFPDSDKTIYFVTCLNGHISADYLGEVRFETDANGKTQTLPHGEGMLYVHGVTKGHFDHGMLHGPAEIIMDNGLHFQGHYQRGAVIEGTTTYHNGASIECLYHNERIHGRTVATSPTGTRTEFEMNQYTSLPVVPDTKPATIGSTNPQQLLNMAAQASAIDLIRTTYNRTTSLSELATFCQISTAELSVVTMMNAAIRQLVQI